MVAKSTPPSPSVAVGPLRSPEGIEAALRGEDYLADDRSAPGSPAATMVVIDAGEVAGAVSTGGVEGAVAQVAQRLDGGDIGGRTPESRAVGTGQRLPRTPGAIRPGATHHGRGIR